MAGPSAQLKALFFPGGRFFYGWNIVAAAGGLQMLAGMLWMQSYGAYVVFLQAEFGWSKTLIAAAFALTRIESGILGPLQGWLVDRYGPKLILSIGTLLFGFGFMWFSWIDSLLEFYLAFGLIAVGSSLGGFATVMVAIVNWFDRHRSKAVAWSQIGYSIGGMAVPLVVLALEAWGWRFTAFMSGVLVLVLGLPMAQVVRHRPQPFGAVPDGARATQHTDTAHDAPKDLTARQAMATASFWLISVGHASALLTVSAIMVHLVAHLSDGLGYTLTAAAVMVTVVTGSQMVGQLLGGYLGDRFDKRYLSVACMIAHAVALLGLAYAETTWQVVLLASVHGLAWGIRGPLMVALRADYFGASAFGTIMGFSSLIVMLGMSFGPVIAGVMADLSGNYQSGFTMLALAAFVGGFCFLFANPPHRTTTQGN